MMHGITIDDRDATNRLAFDLKDVLEVIGTPAKDSRWRIAAVSALNGDAATELHSLSDEGTEIPGHLLFELANRVGQVIEGTFVALRPTGGTPWLTIYAVDSSAYDVETDDDDILARLRARFRSVHDLPAS